MAGVGKVNFFWSVTNLVDCVGDLGWLKGSKVFFFLVGNESDEQYKSIRLTNG